ncbi:helix-turn-helix transcriptional regulator [[Mycobacterium] wendilense]|uniref:LuxR C-terminal-related transcriptional regulator n=1 Tax=[Mycobacterium] wendilense TaxID=3064284 RepID=A0ABM9MGN1_9MYCO|nr:LuxR C-terminal-related transcriptional regulator [Mycolicibacterium sp. MU0050]CAJ1584745.1 LuxR C-terminal-related transcriptional regulator [Mycolicibacterium sp. MU0050]
MPDPLRCVGRDREATALDDLVGAAAHGARIVTLCGPPGIGKTALLRRLAAQHTCRWATGMAWETDLPGGVLAQLLQDEIPTDPVEAAAHLLDHLRAGDIRVLLIDDAQHADTESLQAISTLVRHQSDQPVLVVLATVSADRLPADLGADEIRLTGLTVAAVGELMRMRGISVHPAMAETLSRHTDGNPRDVLALLDEVPPAVWSRPDAVLPAPGHVVDEVATALQSCGSDGRALTEALAILGAGAPLAEAAQLAGLADPLPAIDDATAAGLLRLPGQFEPRLRSGLAEAAVVQLMGVRAAAEAHRRAAEIVSDPAARLRHRVAATPMPDAALADEVATLARERGTDGAWAEAAALFRDASRLTPEPMVRDARLTLAVDALVAAGDCGAAAALVPAVESMRETPLRNAVLGYLAILRGRATEAEARLQRAWTIVNAERDPAIAALIAQRYVLHTLIRGRGDELVGWADTALRLAQPDSPEALEAAAVRGLGMLAAGHPRSAAIAYEELADRVRHGAQAQRVTMGRGWVQLLGDDLDGARSQLETAVATAALGGSRRITLWALGWLARVHFDTGEWDSALAAVESGRTLAASSGIVVVTPLLEWTATQIHAMRGDWSAAAQAVRAADVVTQDYEMMQIPLVLARAQIAEAEADYARVCRTLQPLARMAPGTSLDEPGYWAWPDVLAHALVLEGRLDDAEAFLGPHEQRARDRNHRSATARLGYARGRLLGARGDLPAARAAFEESLALLDGLPRRYDRARVNFVYGQTLRRAGKRREADAVIGAARDIYDSLGARTYVARCERELKAGGLNQLRGARHSVQLTPQEEAVTALVAQGKSNREVAAELYVSPKTVQYHLTRVYAKLGIRSRTELAARGPWGADA